MRIAAVQMLSSADPAANLATVVERTARRGRRRAPSWSCSPRRRCACFGRSLTEVAEPLDGPVGRRGRGRRTPSTESCVVAGMFTPAPGGRVTNTLYVVGPDDRGSTTTRSTSSTRSASPSPTPSQPGERPARGQTSAASGSASPPATTSGSRTCSPRWPTAGAQVVVLPASWGAGPGKLEQWRLLARARALDATTYVVAAGQADPGLGRRGDHVDRRRPASGTAWRSRPTGEVLGELGAEPGLAARRPRPGRRRPPPAATLPVLANRRI